MQDYKLHVQNYKLHVQDYKLHVLLVMSRAGLQVTRAVSHATWSAEQEDETTIFLWELLLLVSVILHSSC